MYHFEQYSPNKYIFTSTDSFTKPPLGRTSFSKGRSFLFLWEIQFHKASFNSSYPRSSLKLKEGANVY